ncbi:hypothetical protein CPAR01_05723 [Colletotrichum paranaense]|uniref:Methyltransferase domain-containing protein n=1 Tax=Colletotrichum paranaense TaxID=1914294 RepID=A0ABQ9SS37_9PEZI|nr:uncharacterized protein CPAR01_05723 [Colletotrichum paranaense]KAK1542336.1 hypothetical protein CPAR01_05723 [Colletotrichum paranaense]
MADEATPNLPAHRIPTDRDTNSPFWTETFPPLEEHTKRLFIEYAKIPEDKLQDHLEEAHRQRNTDPRPLSPQRRKAWNDCPYPCIGLWLFLKLQLRSNKEFDEAVWRTQRGENLVDFGCAVGQDLRSLLHAGSPPQSLHGIDLTPSFFSAGKSLFNDPHTPITFLQANALSPPSTLPSSWRNNFTIITANYVQHCFSLQDQETYAAFLLALLSGKPNDLIFGRTAGTKDGEARREEMHKGQRLYRHTEASFVKFWTRVAAQHGRRARIETWVDEVPAFELRGEGMERFEPVKNLMYSIRFE